MSHLITNFQLLLVKLKKKCQQLFGETYFLMQNVLNFWNFVEFLGEISNYLTCCLPWIRSYDRTLELEDWENLCHPNLKSLILHHHVNISHSISGSCHHTAQKFS